MAEDHQIEEVRANTGEPDDASDLTDEHIGNMIDALGVEGATVSIWRTKVAAYSKSVDVTEAGASHKFSGKFNNAMKALEYWEGRATATTSTTTSVTRVKQIQRS